MTQPSKKVHSSLACRTGRRTVSLLAGGALLSLCACHADAPARADPAGPTASELHALSRPSADTTDADYSARTVTLRLFGTSGTGDDAFATLADTATWQAGNYRIGDAVGSSLRILAVTQDGAQLRDLASGRAIRVAAGEDVTVRIIEHAFDRAAIDHGEHRWSVRADALARIVAQEGEGDAAVAMAQPFAGYQGVSLAHVRPTGLFARLGLHTGDLILAIDGEAATRESLAALRDDLRRPYAHTRMLTIARGGSVWEAQYTME